MTVGFIGLGIMGSRMAANLQRGGHDLVVHNRTRDKAAALLAGGARWADTGAEVGRQVDVLFTMLANPEAVSGLALGPDGFLDPLRESALWVDCSTVNPSFSRRMAAEAQARGIRFLDAPVTGSKAAAEAGELTFMVGGDAADVAACQPFFDLMGRRTVHVGGHGMGASLKIVFNLLVAEAVLAFSEAIALGRSLGLSQEILHAFLIGSPAVAPVMALKRPKFESDDYEADFPLRWMWKDLHLAALTAYEQGVALPGGNVAKEIYAMAVRSGLADQDFSVLYRFMGGKGAGEQEVSRGE